MTRYGTPSLRSPSRLLLGLVTLWIVVELFLLWTESATTTHHLLIALLAVAIILHSLIRDRERLLRRVDDTLESVRRLEAEREKTRRTYRALLEGAGNPIFIFDGSTGVLREVNRKGMELLGCEKDRLLSLTAREMVASESRERFAGLVQRVVRRGRGRAEGIVLLREGGEPVLVEIEARRVDAGDERFVYATVRNVTARHRAEREIRQRNRELTILNTIIAHANESLRLESTLSVILQEVLTAFGAVAGTIHLVAADGTQRLAAEEGISPLEARELSEFHCPAEERRPCAGGGNDHCCPQADFARGMGWGATVGIPLFLRRRLVGTMHLIWKEKPTLSPDDEQFFVTLGNQIGIVVEHLRVFGELHARNDELSRSYRLLEKRTQQLFASQKRLRENLVRSETVNRELARLDQMKSRFLGMISHEFRTPLTGILGSVELLQTGGEALSDADRSLLKIISDSAGRLNEIVTDLIKVAKIESRSVSVRLEPVDVSSLIGEVVTSFAPLVEARRQRIVVTPSDTLPTIDADREYLREVLTELVENAVKFTRDGGVVQLTTSLVVRDDLLSRIEVMERFSPGFFDGMGERIHLLVEVKDSGIGVDLTERTLIFEKFYEGGEIRHHHSSKHRFLGRGAGLGLAIVKGLVEAHRGMIWVEGGERLHPDHDPGSSFLVLLPVDPAPVGSRPLSCGDRPETGPAV